VKARAVKTARAQAVDILWAADSDVCEIPRITLATVLDDLARVEDELAKARAQVHLMELWRIGWEQYVRNLNPPPTSPSGRSPLASGP
jgi:hypothetical protein